MPSTKFVLFGSIGKTRWPPWPLIGWDIFDFSSETTERYSTKLDRKQDLNALYQVCVFRADWKNKMATPASDWLRHFWLLCRNCWTEFNEAWQEASSQCPLPSLCFSGRSEKQVGRLSSDLLRHFRLLLWNRWTVFNETWQEASRWRSKRPLPSMCFSGRSETAERNSTKLDRKQVVEDLNALYQVCVFRADQKNMMAALASDLLRHFRLLWRNRWMEFNESKLSMPSTTFLFFRPIKEKTKWPPWPLIGWDIFDFSSETAKRNSTKLDREQDLNALYQVCVFQVDQKNKWPPRPMNCWDIFNFSSETPE